MEDRREKSKILKQLADEQTPTPDFVKHGNLAADAIFNALKSSDLISVDRVLIAGSMGKRTALGNEFDPDYDLVVFINDEEPPFDSTAIDNFEYAIRRKGLPGYKLLRKTKHSVKCQLRFGGHDYSFDVLPAANFAQISKQPSVARQRLKKHQDRYKSGYSFSSSLAEQTVLFMRKRPKDVVNCIKIAKYWNQQIDFDRYISGRSHIIELVAVKANSGKAGCSLVIRFQRFLKMMSELGEVRIIFGHNYKRTSIPDHILEQDPLVLDPVNPYNNLLEGLHSSIIARFQECAKETLHRLEDLGNFYDLDKLFSFTYNNNYCF